VFGEESDECLERLRMIEEDDGGDATNEQGSTYNRPSMATLKSRYQYEVMIDLFLQCQQSASTIPEDAWIINCIYIYIYTPIGID
jgi:hypothetical protein